MVSAWIEHVKKYASENGVSYRQAMKDSKATYVSQAKPKAPRKPRAPPKQQAPSIPKIKISNFDEEAEWDENDPMNFMTGKQKAPRKPRAPRKPKAPKAPKGPPKPRGRPRKLTEREIQMAQGDTAAQLFEEAKNRMKAKDLRKVEKKRKPPKRKVKVIKYDEEAEWDENDPMNFMSAKEEQEAAPILESPFKQPPSIVLPEPYVGKISNQIINKMNVKYAGKQVTKGLINRGLKRHRQLALLEEIELDPRTLINKESEKIIKQQQLLEKAKGRAKQIYNQGLNKKLIDLLEEPPSVKKAKENAIRLSEIESMGKEEQIQQEERAYIREKKKIKPLDIIAEKEKRRLKRYKKEADQLIAKAKKDKEFEKLMASYGVPKSRRQILEERANDWSSEF